MQEPTLSRLVARLQIVATTILFSTGGAAIKATALTSWQVAGFRSGVAALVVPMLMPAALRHLSWRSLLVGSTYGATLILYVLANKLTTAANTIFLQSTAPLYVLLLAPWLLRERVRRVDVLYMAVLAAGLGMFFVGIDEPSATAPDPLAGNWLAAAAGVGWGLTILGLRWLEATTGGRGASAVLVGNFLAFVVSLPWALPLTAGGLRDWSIVVYLGTFQIALAYFLLTSALRWIPALETSLLLLLEPVLNPIWAWLVHGEKPGPWSLAGGAVILVATALKSWWSFRHEPGPS